MGFFDFLGSKSKGAKEVQQGKPASQSRDGRKFQGAGTDAAAKARQDSAKKK